VLELLQFLNYVLWEASDFIPSPNVAEDHQTKNAKAIVEKKELFY
jgi:hypothetical protein